MEKLAPKGNTYYDKRAEHYERKRKKQPWWHVEQQEMQTLLDTLPKGISVLDVPFGTGRFVPYYRERGYQISGLDASGHMVDAARTALGDEAYYDCFVCVGDAAKLRYPNGAFDLLVSTRFLRDIVTFGMAKQMLKEFARVTRRWAIIQLGEAPEGGEMPTDDETMAGRMSRQMVDDLLITHGFRPVERRLVATGEDGNRIHHILCERLPN